jgi:hypothetical protein
MADKNDTLLREVDEELRRERLEKLWDRYGIYVVAVAALLVLGVAGYQYTKSRNLAAAQAAGARYEEALRLSSQGKPEEAAKIFSALAESGPQGYSTLARLQLAGAAVEAGRTADAVAIYDALARESGLDPLLKGYAQFQAAALRAGEADFTELQNRLNDLTADASPWRYSARELLGLAALKAGRTEEARKMFEQLLADQRTPPSIMERARIAMASVVAADLAKPAAGAETGAAAGEAPKTGAAAAAGPEKK